MYPAPHEKVRPLKTDAELFYVPGKPNPGPEYITSSRPATQRYKKPDKLLENPDAIVIGTGIGGLSIASALAQKRGMKVLMLEHQKVPGGSTHCHEIDGFEFNSGVDSIGDMDPRVGRGLFRATADFITGGKLDVGEDARRARDGHLRRRGPTSASPRRRRTSSGWSRSSPAKGNVRKYYELEDKIQRDAWSWAITKMAPSWVPEGAREAFYGTFGGKWRKYMHRKTAEVFQKELGFSKRLTAIFSYMYGNHGSTPEHSPFSFHAANLYHYRDGAYYPVGGPSQIANCVIPIVEAAGGQLAVSTPVEQILIENGRAVGVRLLGDGTRIRSKMVISDASAWVTFMELLPEAEREKHGYAKRFEQTGPSPAMCYLFLGYDEEIELPQAHHLAHAVVRGRRPVRSRRRRHGLQGPDALRGHGRLPAQPVRARPGLQGALPGQVDRHRARRGAGRVGEAVPRRPRRSAPASTRACTTNMLKLVHRHMPMLKGKTPRYGARRRSGGMQPARMGRLLAGHRAVRRSLHPRHALAAARRPPSRGCG